jgi:hypothetical protein
MDRRILYKYLDAKGGLKMLENSTLKFNNAVSFNDPFDNHPSLMDYSNVPEALSQGVGADFIRRMYKGGCILSHANTWICSLSKVYNDLLMWSYYGNHKGICVGLDMDKTKAHLSKLRGMPEGCPEIEVQYKDIIKKPDIYRSNEDLAKYQIGTKAKAWKHEQEVRLYMYGNCEKPLFDLEHSPSFPHIGGECFYSLYLGVRIDEANMSKVIIIARQRNPDIKIYQMKIDTDAFKLNPEIVE